MRQHKYLVGVISDTHGLYDPVIEPHFKGVQHILHAGDVGNPNVLFRLSKLGPVTAVRGNVDERIHSLSLPPEVNISLFGIRIFMTHILGNPERPPTQCQTKAGQNNPSVVIFGHTHQASLRKLNGILYLNPGSAGPSRFSLPRSIGLLAITNGKVDATIIEI